MPSFVEGACFYKNVSMVCMVKLPLKMLLIKAMPIKNMLKISVPTKKSTNRIIKAKVIFKNKPKQPEPELLLVTGG